MEKYILVSKDYKKNIYTVCKSNDYRYIYHEYKLWKNILPKEYFAIYIKLEEF